MTLLFPCVLVLLAFASVAAFAPSTVVHRPLDKDVTVVLLATRQGKRRGFGNQKAGTGPPPNEKSIYSLPALYDLAFGYRSYEDEVDFLMYAHKAHSGKPPTRVLELAAGPARHSLTALTLEDSPVESVMAVDLSTEMKEYAMQLANEKLSGKQQESFHYLCADMRQSLNDTVDAFDSVWILLGSLQHLQTNEDVISCFKSACQALQPGGTLIVELPHPRETFAMVECTKNEWQVPLQDENGEECGELQILWGDETDTLDPIRQVRQFTVSFDLTGTKETDRQSVKQIVPMRLFTAQEIDALARCSGFDVVAKYGALDKQVQVDDEDEAFRLVCVLRKTKT